jgi:RNA polymerase sigma-70 factor, ECF subfamily
MESTVAISVSEAALVERIQLGERELFYDLVQPYLGRLYKIVRPLLHSHADAEDVLQQTLLRALENVDRLGSVRMFRAWLTQIAVNEVRLRWRRKSYRAPHYSIDERVLTGDDNLSVLELADTREGPMERFSRQELRALLQRSLKRLSRAHREVFVLRELGELSTEQTADTLGVPVSTVKIRLHRARMQLRRMLAPALSRGNQAPIPLIAAAASPGGCGHTEFFTPF